MRALWILGLLFGLIAFLETSPVGSSGSASAQEAADSEAVGDAGLATQAPVESEESFVDSPELLKEVEQLEKEYLDVSGVAKYRRAGHQYTTYIVSMAAGLGRDRSYELAYFSQFPDDEKRFSATLAAIYLFTPKYRREIMAVLHSLHGGNHEAVLKRRRSLQELVAQGIAEGTLKDYQVGLIIHALADSYAHTKEEDGKLVAFGYAVGHLFHGHEPDLIAYAPEKYKAYTCALFEALSQRTTCTSELAELHAMIERLKKQRNTELPKFEAYAQDEAGFDRAQYEAHAAVWNDSVSKDDVRSTIGAMEAHFSR